MGWRLSLPLRQGVVEPKWQMAPEPLGLAYLERRTCPIAGHSVQKVSAAALETFPA